MKIMKIVIAVVILVAMSLIFLYLISGEDNVKIPSRIERIPSDVVKITPETDYYPPILHSDEFEEPVPFYVVNTAGAEDSPFIPHDRDEFYFVFVKDVRENVSVQIRNIVNGIWYTKKEKGEWREPELVLLQKPDELALNGCQFISGDQMIFCSTREGYSGLHWFTAEFKDGVWKNWKKTDFEPNFNVGELHISSDGKELFYHSRKEGGKGGLDIWRLTKEMEGVWKNPENFEIVNSEVDEGWPYLSPDGNELWFNRWYFGSPGLFRSKKINGEWQEPELIISQFAGEPTLDNEGNLYFVHHFFKDGVMLEADIYVSYKK